MEQSAIKTSHFSIGMGMIDNCFIATQQLVSINAPDNLQPCGTIQAMQRLHINAAFKAARCAFAQWKRVSFTTRRLLVEKWLSLVTTSYREQIINLIVTEVGKNVTAATSEFTRTVALVRQLITQAQPICVPAFTTDNIFNNKKVGLFFRVPRGVVLAIAPYNYPLNLAISKIIPALLTGNTIVFKPATNGSLLGTLLGNIFYQSGFAPGVINVVVGKGHDIGHALTTHPEIDVIGFTGSFAVGQQLLVNHPQAHIFLELGGKDAAIVLKDANLSLAVECIVNGALSFSGQRCTAIKLVVCEEPVADQLITLLKQKLAKLTVGSARNNAFITPLINQKSADYVSALINDAVEHGARVVMGHQQEQNLVWPTIIDHVTLNMRIATEEQFGPVIPIIRFQTLKEAITAANYSQYGLQAAIFTENWSQAWKIAPELTVGTVNFNGQTQRGPDEFPFLGVKGSGYGAPQGIAGSLLSCTRVQGIVLNHQ